MIIITEFQSTVDPWMCVRVLAYIVLLWLDLIQKKIISPETGSPPVFPIILYTGEENWNAPVDISKLFSPDAKLIEKYLPSFKCLLVKEKDLSDALLLENKNFFTLFERLKRAT